MEIILSTRNPSKAEQIKAIFGKNHGMKLLTLEEAGIDGEAVEDGDTLLVNALKKASYASEHSHPGTWAMADDTGIFIEALNGAPGVYSARWAGEVSTEEITDYTLNRLKGVTNRKATFRTTVALINPQGTEYFFDGEIHGQVLETPRCKPQPKMPYSGIFLPNKSSKVWAEMSLDEENKISHRGIAFRKALEFLKTQD